MSDFQFIILVLLLLWIIYRTPSRWQQHLRQKWIYDQLNEINASARGLSVAQVEQEFSNYLSNASCIPRWRRFFY